MVEVRSVNVWLLRSVTSEEISTSRGVGKSAFGDRWKWRRCVRGELGFALEIGRVAGGIPALVIAVAEIASCPVAPVVGAVVSEEKSLKRSIEIAGNCAAVVFHRAVGNRLADSISPREWR